MNLQTMREQWIAFGIVLLIQYAVADAENMAEFLDEDELDCEVNLDNFLQPQKWVRIAPSLLAGAGDGIFATTFIKRFTFLAEYEGEVIINEDEISDYAWDIYRGGKVIFYVDAYNETTSNWVRWINCSRHSKETNVEYYGCRGRAFYTASRDIWPGEELYVYYGHTYAKNLDIDTDNFWNEDVDWNLYRDYACSNIKV